MITSNKERITLRSRNSIPPSRGSNDWAVTAENVVNPAQKPGSKSKRNWLTPRRSMRTKSAAASATPIRFAAKVPSRSLGRISPIPYRAKVPATPPIETKTKEFRVDGISY